MNRLHGTIHSGYAMQDAACRAQAVAALEASGYRCSIDDLGDRWLLAVDHSSTDLATVRWTVLHTDPAAICLPV